MRWWAKWRDGGVYKEKQQDLVTGQWEKEYRDEKRLARAC
jgi:hypothetical protein